MIRLRKECPEVGWGVCDVLPTRSRHVLALAHRWQGNTVVCVHNLDARPHEISLRVGGEAAGRLSDLLDPRETHAGDGGLHRLSLEPHGYRWYRAR